jgi:hypothetical protein
VLDHVPVLGLTTRKRLLEEMGTMGKVKAAILEGPKSEIAPRQGGEGLLASAARTRPWGA